MKLIINSDDFGYTSGISEGILYGHRHGIITSTTVLVNSDIERIYLDSVKKMGVGLHLNLTLGKPILSNSNLVDNQGNFLPLENNLGKLEIKEEFNAQIKRFTEIFGCYPDHLDSHHGLHRYPKIEFIIREMMSRFNLPARELSGIKLIRDFYGENASVDNFIKILEENLNEEVIEVMCHVGFCDVELEQKSQYTTGRLNELNILTHPKVIEYIEKNKIELISYGDLIWI